MSTSVKGLAPYQILFHRPAIALGWLLVVAMIAIKPSYNAVPVLFAIPGYWILYQNRKSIYKMGLGRFNFLAVLIYVCFFLSMCFEWQSKDIGIVDQLGNISIKNFMFHSNYRIQEIHYIIANLDNLIHWKMIIFTPAISAVLYLVFVEFDRQSVKATDLQNLGLTSNDLLRRNDIVEALNLVLFVAVSVFFGWKYLLVAGIVLAIYSWIRPNLYATFALTATLLIVVFSYAGFEYVTFLSIPRQVVEYTANTIADKGISALFKMYFVDLGKMDNFGQWLILTPYLLFTGLSALTYARNRAAFQESFREQEKQYEVATTADALDFGYELATRKPVRLTHKELNTHMYINGASGSGKTIAMLNFVVEAAQKGIPLVYIDGKGSTDLEDKISGIAAKYSRKFKVFTLSPDAVPETSPYDFLGAGTFTEKKNRVMELFKAAESAGTDYYMDNLETFINRVFMVIHQQKLKIDLFRFLTLISNINDLVQLAEHDIVLEDGSRVNLKTYFEDVRDMKPEQSPRTRLLSKLDPFIHSSYGHLFNVIDKQNVINIKQSIKSGEIVLFLFDASAFSFDTSRVAKMVISDINATFAELGKDHTRVDKTPIKTFCCFDEFKSYETDAIGKTIALHRSNGMHAIIGTQSLALIDKNIGNGILTNCQTHFVMASAEADADRFAEEFGKYDKIDHTTRIKVDVQEVADISTRKVKDYVIDKQKIKDIQVELGHGFLHRKAIGAKPAKIQVTKKV